jgi:uncharacterized membrane protein
MQDFAKQGLIYTFVMVIFRLGWSNSEIISQTSVHRIVDSKGDCYYPMILN